MKTRRKNFPSQKASNSYNKNLYSHCFPPFRDAFRCFFFVMLGSQYKKLMIVLSKGREVQIRECNFSVHWTHCKLEFESKANGGIKKLEESCVFEAHVKRQSENPLIWKKRFWANKLKLKRAFTRLPQLNFLLNITKKNFFLRHGLFITLFEIRSSHFIRQHQFLSTCQFQTLTPLNKSLQSSVNFSINFVFCIEPKIRLKRIKKFKLSSWWDYISERNLNYFRIFCLKSVDR